MPKLPYNPRFGRTDTLRVHPIVSPAQQEQELAFGADVYEERKPQIGPLKIRLWDASTQLLTNGDGSNSYQTYFYETSPFNDDLRRRLTAEVLSGFQYSTPAAPVRINGSNREVYSKHWPLQKSDEVTGYVLGMDFFKVHNGVEVRTPEHFELVMTRRQAEEPWDADAAIAQYKDLAPYVDDSSRQSFEAVKAGLYARKYEEKWDPSTAARVGRDVTIVMRVNPGRLRLAFQSYQHFHRWSWSLQDAAVAEFEVTSGQLPGGPEVVADVASGDADGSFVDCFLFPRRHRYLYKYFALYYNITLFWVTITYSVSIGTFDDRLPFYPYGYAYTTTFDTGINDVAVSGKIQRSSRYALSLAQDLALQYFTAYSVQVLVARVEGQWTLKEGGMYAGECCSIVHVRRGRQIRELRTFRRTTIQPTLALLDFGRLSTQEVAGWTGGFNFSEEYGPL